MCESTTRPPSAEASPAARNVAAWPPGPPANVSPGRFAPGPGYAAVAALFARELALAEQDRDELLEEWEEVYDEIRRRVSLVSPRGPVPEFLLHVSGGEAWFRWSDEPFEGT